MHNCECLQDAIENFNSMDVVRKIEINILKKNLETVTKNHQTLELENIFKAEKIDLLNHPGQKCWRLAKKVINCRLNDIIFSQGDYNVRCIQYFVKKNSSESYQLFDAPLMNSSGIQMPLEV